MSLKELPDWWIKQAIKDGYEIVCPVKEKTELIEKPNINKENIEVIDND